MIPQVCRSFRLMASSRSSRRLPHSTGQFTIDIGGLLEKRRLCAAGSVSLRL